MAEMFFDGVSKLPQGIQTLLLLLTLMYVLFFLDEVMTQDRIKNSWSITPRKWINPLRFLSHAWVHDDFSHLASNTIAFLMLGSMIALEDLQEFWVGTIVICILCGLGIWFFACNSNSSHLGESGLIMGYYGYILTNGFFIRDVNKVILASVLIALLSFTRYSLFGNLRFRDGVSNVGHWFGFFGGIGAAYFWSVLQQQIIQ